MAYEIWTLDDSGDGDERSSRYIRASEHFGVLKEAITNDAVLIVQARKRPYGTPHFRWPEVVSSIYQVEKTDHPLVDFVRVIYEHPLASQLDDWTIVVDYGSTTDKMYLDLDGKLIGMPAYKPVGPEDPLYPQAQFWAQSGEGPVRLYWQGGKEAPRIRSGTDVLKGATAVRLTRKLKMMTARLLREVDHWKTKTNAEPFIAWEPGELLFTEARIGEEATGVEMNDKPNTGYMYPCELVFAVNYEGWEHQKNVHRFTDSDGNESLVYPGSSEEPGEPVRESFRVHEKVDFYGLIALLERGSITGSLGGRRKG